MFAEQKGRNFPQLRLSSCLPTLLHLAKEVETFLPRSVFPSDQFLLHSDRNTCLTTLHLHKKETFLLFLHFNTIWKSAPLLSPDLWSWPENICPWNVLEQIVFLLKSILMGWKRTSSSNGAMKADKHSRLTSHRRCQLCCIQIFLRAAALLSVASSRSVSASAKSAFGGDENIPDRNHQFVDVLLWEMYTILNARFLQKAKARWPGKNWKPHHKGVNARWAHPANRICGILQVPVVFCLKQFFLKHNLHQRVKKCRTIPARSLEKLFATTKETWPKDGYPADVLL